VRVRAAVGQGDRRGGTQTRVDLDAAGDTCAADVDVAEDDRTARRKSERLNAHVTVAAVIAPPESRVDQRDLRVAPRARLGIRNRRHLVPGSQRRVNTI
jgi:hypothetical protein